MRKNGRVLDFGQNLKKTATFAFKRVYFNRILLHLREFILICILLRLREFILIRILLRLREFILIHILLHQFSQSSQRIC